MNRKIPRIDRRFVHKTRRTARREAKHLRLRVRPVPPAAHPLLHLLGCQRSGTTMLTDVLDGDPQVRVHGELEDLFDRVPRHHRLKDIAEVRGRLLRSGASLDVVKPLVESHRAAELLALHPDAVAVWMFRHYSGVAMSHLKRFGDDVGRSNLEAIVDDDRADWRNAGITPGLRATVRQLYSRDMPPHDAAALFWYCRNTLYFEQQLDSDERVRTCEYDHLVTEPAAVLDALARWVGIEPPAVGMVHDRSVGNGRDLDIDPVVRGLCDDMWSRLLEVDRTRALTTKGGR
jgi:hypothetical protein